MQLPFYALLAEKELKQTVSQVSYLSLSKNVKFGAQLAGEELENISEQIGERLSRLIRQMNEGKELTAWGDEKTCQYRNIKRICRKQAWNNVE